MGIFRDYYCAYSDTDVRVNSFELHIDCQLFERSDINIVPSRKRHIPSKGNSNTLVDKEDTGDFAFTPMTVSCFGSVLPFNQLTLYRDSHTVR